MVDTIRIKLGRIIKFIILFPFMVKVNNGFWFTVWQLSYRFISRGVYGVKEYCRIFEERRSQTDVSRHESSFMNSLTDSLWDSVDGDAARWLKAQEMKKGYIVYTVNYTPNSAGIICSYRLCNYLNNMGYLSYITNSIIAPAGIKAPIISHRYARKLAASGFTVVYIETISGNPLSAPYVARWVANRPGLLAGEETYDDRELVFYYSDVYLPYIKNRVAGKLYMPTIDESIFYYDNNSLESRCLECFYVGKSQWKDGYVNKEKAFEITRDYPKKSDLGKLFRASRVLYCFDNSTILAYEALMCGCPVVIIPDGTQTWEDYQKLELGTDGIAWGLAGLENARIDVVKLQERYSKAKLDFRNQLVEFIYLTQKRVLG